MTATETSDNPINAKITALLRELEPLTVESLYAEFRRCLCGVADLLLRQATIVRILEARGEDLQARHLPNLHYLRRLAWGQTLPELFARFGHKPKLLRLAERLPLPDQERLSAGEPVRLMVLDENGGHTHRMADPAAMRAEQIDQAFGAGYIRGDAEQLLFVSQQRLKARRGRPEQIGELQLDYERAGAVIGKKFIPVADLWTACRALRRNLE